MTATISTPLDLICDSLSIKPGKWRTEQPGVNAPDRAKSINIQMTTTIGCCHQSRKGLTWNGEQDNLLIRKLFTSIVGLRDTTGGNLGFLVGIGNPSRLQSVICNNSNNKALRPMTYENWTPSGKLSPALSPDIVEDSLNLFISAVELM